MRLRSLVLQKLAQRPTEFAVKGLVRTEDSANKLLSKVPEVRRRSAEASGPIAASCGTGLSMPPVNAFARLPRTRRTR